MHFAGSVFAFNLVPLTEHPVPVTVKVPSPVPDPPDDVSVNSSPSTDVSTVFDTESVAWATGAVNVNVAAADGAAVVFIAAGLAIIALKALTPLANYISLMTMLILSGQAARLSAASMHIDGLTSIAMFLLGLLLILKSRPLARYTLRH